MVNPPSSSHLIPSHRLLVCNFTTFLSLYLFRHLFYTLHKALYYYSSSSSSSLSPLFTPMPYSLYIHTLWIEKCWRIKQTKQEKAYSKELKRNAHIPLNTPNYKQTSWIFCTVFLCDPNHPNLPLFLFGYLFDCSLCVWPLETSLQRLFCFVCYFPRSLHNLLSLWCTYLKDKKNQQICRFFFFFFLTVKFSLFVSFLHINLSLSSSHSLCYSHSPLIFFFFPIPLS